MEYRLLGGTVRALAERFREVREAYIAQGLILEELTVDIGEIAHLLPVHQHRRTFGGLSKHLHPNSAEPRRAHSKRVEHGRLSVHSRQGVRVVEWPHSAQKCDVTDSRSKFDRTGKDIRHRSRDPEHAESGKGELVRELLNVVWPVKDRPAGPE
jgi:hypothetical protein